MTGESTPHGSGSHPLHSDPQALRALAHPLRWKLLDVLESESSATATRCAEVVGESVASCAYHLGILAKYGYVEPVPERSGREKPWQLRDRQQTLSGDGLDLEGRLAVEAAAEAFLEHEFARFRNRLRQRDREPKQWRDASFGMGTTLYVTAEELQEIRKQITQVALKYRERDENPALRPPGARQARLFAATSVEPRPSRQEWE